MSDYSYTSNSSKRPVIISGGSSSRDSTYYESQASDYSTAHSSMSLEPSRDHRYRVPDNDDKFMTVTTSKNGKVEVYNHRAARYDEAEPRSSEYKQPSRESREHRESKSRSSNDPKSSTKHRSSHK